MFTSPDGEEFRKKKCSRLEVYHKIAYCCGRGRKTYTCEDLKLDEESGKIQLIKKSDVSVGKYMHSSKALEDAEPWAAFRRKYGSREQVFNDVSYCIKSGLTKKDLMLNSKGKILTVRKSQMAKERFFKKQKQAEEIEIDVKATKIAKSIAQLYLPKKFILKKKLQFDEELESVREIPNRTDLDKLKEELDELDYYKNEYEYEQQQHIDDENKEEFEEHIDYPEPLPLKMQYKEYEDIQESEDFSSPEFKKIVCFVAPRVYTTRNF